MKVEYRGLSCLCAESGYSTRNRRGQFQIESGTHISGVSKGHSEAPSLRQDSEVEFPTLVLTAVVSGTRYPRCFVFEVVGRGCRLVLTRTASRCTTRLSSSFQGLYVTYIDKQRVNNSLIQNDVCTREGKQKKAFYLVSTNIAFE